MLANATSRPVLLINADNTIATELTQVVSPSEQATEPTTARTQDSIEATSFVVASSPGDHIPIETSASMSSVYDVQEAMSPAESGLRSADEAAKAINLTSTWEGAVARIKWLMDALSPVAGVRHSAMFFYFMDN